VAPGQDDLYRFQCVADGNLAIIERNLISLQTFDHFEPMTAG
jgi:hypothetical protein